MTSPVRRMVRFPDGFRVPAIGQGTWAIGDSSAKKAAELAALRTGIQLGMTLVDTAEMYGGGRSERLVGEAIKGMNRSDLFIVSKVLPSNAGRRNIFRSCDTSLHNLGVDYLDLYLLHWRGGVPLSETVACMEELVQQGKIRRWGVSNFDVADMEELWRVPRGSNCAANQVAYNLGSRGIEYDLMPWMAERRVPLMAYYPIAQASNDNGLYTNATVKNVAIRHSATVAQILLSFAIHSGFVIAIPKSSNVEHVKLNAAADAIELTEEDMQELNNVFPPPSHKVPLDTY